MTISWFTVRELVAFQSAPAMDALWCRVLLADLRDPRIAPLLAPSPAAVDYKDEARPATNDRAYFLARRAMQKSLIGAITGVRADDVIVGYDVDGAPRVESPEGLYVSVSGHGPYALLAIGNQRVGVDFESVDDTVEPLSDVLHPGEIEYLNRLPLHEKSEYFLRIWTAKEAYLKAVGRGFLDDPAQVCTGFEGKVVTIARAGVAQTGVTGQLLAAVLDGTDIVAACITITSPAAN